MWVKGSPLRALHFTSGRRSHYHGAVPKRPRNRRFVARCMVSTVSKSGLQVGDPVSDITLPTVAGGEVNLRGFHGKRFILFMWASW